MTERDDDDDDDIPDPPLRPGNWAWDDDAGEWIDLDELDESDFESDRGDDMPEFWEEDMPEDWLEMFYEAGWDIDEMDFEEFEIGVSYGDDT